MVRIGGMRADGLPCKIGEERVDGLPHEIAGKFDAGIIGEELERNELMGSTEKGMPERRITAPWCGSRVAGWRVAVGKTTVSLADIASLASPLVSQDKKWNVMVPRMEMIMTLRKRVTNVIPVTALSALTALLVQVDPRASMASEECVAPMALMATTASMASMASMDGFDGWRRWWRRMVASMGGVDGWRRWSQRKASLRRVAC